VNPADALPLQGRDHLRSGFHGALVGAVVGDAFGAPFKGWRGSVPPDSLSRLEADGRLLRHTDDTAMTFALAESLLFCAGLDEDHLATTFAVAYERDPGRGYGAGTARLLARVAAGDDWRRAARVASFLRHPDSFVDAVRFAIGLGGDTDTIASMAGAICGARLGTAGIPESWSSRCEGAARAGALAERFWRRRSDETDEERRGPRTPPAVDDR
jgi:ADP-ribosylglycohydrolase